MFGMMETVLQRLDRLENAPSHSRNHQASSSFGRQEDFHLPARSNTNRHQSDSPKYKRSHSLDKNFSSFKIYNNNMKDVKSAKLKNVDNFKDLNPINNAEKFRHKENVGRSKNRVNNVRVSYQDQARFDIPPNRSHALVDYDSESEVEHFSNWGNSAPPMGYSSSEEETMSRDHGKAFYNHRDNYFPEPDLESEDEAQDFDNAGNKARLKDIKLLFKDIQAVYPQYFHNNSKDLPFYRNPDSLEARKYIRQEKEIPYLKISPDLSGTWFDPNHFEDQNDSIAVWAPDTKFPIRSRIFPKDYSRKPPHRIPFLKVEDPLVERFLKAPNFKAANLDTSVFGSSSFQVTKFNHPTVDGILRDSLMDSFTSDEIIKILINLVARVDDEHRALGGKGHISSLDPIMQLLLLNAETNVRAEQSVISALVVNKTALREKVLNSYTMSPSTRNILRGSNFLSDKLFGDLPESFKSLVISENGKHLRARYKSKSFNSSLSTNRIAPVSNPSGFFGRPRYGNKSRPLKRLQGSASRFNKRADSKRGSRFFRGQGRRGRR